MRMGHISVLLKEVVEVIGPESFGRYFDGTLGDGGHARSVLERSGPHGELCGTDLDCDAVDRLRTGFSEFSGRVHLFNKNFCDIDRVCLMLNWDHLDGIVLDLGLSSTALDDPERGFAFSKDGPLDMRFSSDSGLDASMVVNHYEEKQIRDIIMKYGQERFASRIARNICASRPIKTTSGLASVVSGAIPRRFWPERIHPATKTFQALRMEVNDEVKNLEAFLPRAASLLSVNAVMAIISYHSIEDRIVKRFFASPFKAYQFPKGFPPPEDNRPKMEVITKRPIRPGAAEIEANPRSRSALLRAARRVA